MAWSFFRRREPVPSPMPAQQEAPPRPPPLDIAAYRNLAAQRLDLGDGTALLMFDVFGLNRLTPDDHRGPVVRYLYATGANRNVFRIDCSSTVLWGLAR